LITAIEPTIEAIQRLASDRTGAIGEDELAQMAFTGQCSIVAIDDHTIMAVCSKGGELWVLAVNGGAEGWIAEANEWLDETAKTEGLPSIRFMGRNGWVKALKDFGYRQAGVVMVKEIST